MSEVLFDPAVASFCETHGARFIVDLSESAYQYHDDDKPNWMKVPCAALRIGSEAVLWAWVPSHASSELRIHASHEPRFAYHWIPDPRSDRFALELKVPWKMTWEELGGTRARREPPRKRSVSWGSTKWLTPGVHALDASPNFNRKLTFRILQPSFKLKRLFRNLTLEPSRDVAALVAEHEALRKKVLSLPEVGDRRDDQDTIRYQPPYVVRFAEAISLSPSARVLKARSELYSNIVVKIFTSNESPDSVIRAAAAWRQEVQPHQKLSRLLSEDPHADNHRIVKFLAADARYMAILYEDLPGVALSLCRNHYHMCNLPEPEMDRVFRDVAAGLSFIHSHGIIHGDIKPANIMYSPQRGATLIDLGLAYSLPEGVRHVRFRGGGTSWYVASECIVLQKISPASDVFSLGITLLFLYQYTCLAEHYFQSFDIADAMIDITKARKLHVEWMSGVAKLGTKLQDEFPVLASILEMNCNKRPSSAELTDKLSPTYRQIEPVVGSAEQIQEDALAVMAGSERRSWCGRSDDTEPLITGEPCEQSDRSVPAVAPLFGSSPSPQLGLPPTQPQVWESAVETSVEADAAFTQAACTSGFDSIHSDPTRALEQVRHTPSPCRSAAAGVCSDAESDRGPRE